MTVDRMPATRAHLPRQPVILRRETDGDRPAIFDLTMLAFSRADESNITDALRANGNLLLSIVAEYAGAIVGHVAISPATISLESRSLAVAALGPIAVIPQHQGNGIGSRLVHHALAECSATGHALVFLLGHPTYYPRFGFKPAKPIGVRWSGDISDGLCEPFMVHESIPNELCRQLNGQCGVFRFAPEFGA